MYIILSILISNTTYNSFTKNRAREKEKEKTRQIGASFLGISENLAIVIMYLNHDHRSIWKRNYAVNVETWMFLYRLNENKHGLRTARERFFSKNSKLLSLGRKIWPKFFGAFWVFFRLNYQNPLWYSESLVHVFHYSTIIFIKKTNIHLGLGYEFGLPRLGI